MANTPDNPIKPWWRSKIVWLNLLAATVLCAAQNITALQGVIPDEVYKWAVFALPVVNLWLRAVTTHGLSFKPQLPAEQEDKSNA